jgi:hypothetical protein
MKKTFISILFIASTITGYGQTSLHSFADNSSPVVNVDIVETTNKKDDMFKNAQTWIAKSYGDYKSVIQFEDKEAGKLILKGISRVGGPHETKLRYVLEIDIKDNKYRAKISDYEASSKTFAWNEPGSFYSIESRIKSGLHAKKELDSLKTLDREKLKKKQIKDLELSESVSVLMFSEFESIRLGIIKSAKDTFDSLKTQLAKKDDF